MFRHVYGFDFPRRLRLPTASRYCFELVRYRRLLAAHNVCICFSWPAVVRSVAACAGVPISLVWLCQEQLERKRLMRRVRMRVVFHTLQRFRARIVCPSYGMLTEVLAARYPRDLTAVIPNGVDICEPRGSTINAAERRAFRALRGIPADAFAICCSARLDLNKDHATLLRALARALPQCPELYLLCLGAEHADGDGCRAQLLQLAERLGIAARVAWLGHQQDVRPWLAASDAAILASRREVAPLSLLEAAALALPLVATRVGGVPELVIDNKTGLLFEPGDEQGCSDALLHLAADRSWSRQLGVQAQNHCKARFDRRITESQWDALLGEMLSHGVS